MIAESDLEKTVKEKGAYFLEQLQMPAGTGVSGLESDGGERFFCGGGGSGYGPPGATNDALAPIAKSPMQTRPPG